MVEVLPAQFMAVIVTLSGLLYGTVSSAPVLSVITTSASAVTLYVVETELFHSNVTVTQQSQNCSILVSPLRGNGGPSTCEEIKE